MKKNLIITLENDTHEKVREAAKEQKRSVKNHIETLVEDSVKPKPYVPKKEYEG